MIGGWFLFISIGLGLVGVVISSITERFQSAKVLEFLSDEDSIAEDVSISCMLCVVLVTSPLLKLQVRMPCRICLEGCSAIHGDVRCWWQGTAAEMETKTEEPGETTSEIALHTLRETLQQKVRCKEIQLLEWWCEWV